MNTTEKITVQDSAHPHYLEAKKAQVDTIIKNEQGSHIIKFIIYGDGIITHGKHGTIKTESKYIIKYVQQEFNPFTRKMMDAFD